MDKEQKRTFIHELMDNTREDLERKLDRVPEEWDGHELRQWIADTFASSVYRHTMKGSRLREYHNDVAVNNL